MSGEGFSTPKTTPTPNPHYRLYVQIHNTIEQNNYGNTYRYYGTH